MELRLTEKKVRQWKEIGEKQVPFRYPTDACPVLIDLTTDWLKFRQHVEDLESKLVGIHKTVNEWVIRAGKKDDRLRELEEQNKGALVACGITARERDALKERVKRLEREHDKALTDVKTCEAFRRGLREQLEEAERENAKLRQDKERLSREIANMPCEKLLKIMRAGWMFPDYPDLKRKVEQHKDCGECLPCRERAKRKEKANGTPQKA